MILPLRSGERGGVRCFCPRWRVRRQRLANLKTFRQVAEKGRPFPGQHAGQPMSHDHQDGGASVLAFEPALPGGLMGKDHIGAVGEFVRERFRDGCPKIIARLIQNVPGQIQRTITGLLLKPANRNMLFSVQGIHAFFFLTLNSQLSTSAIRDRRVNFSFHALNIISSGAQRLSKPVLRYKRLMSSPLQDKSG
jgi:hypothetical protein